VFVVSGKGEEYKDSLLDEHALLMKASGVKDIIILINKLDLID